MIKYGHLLFINRSAQVVLVQIYANIFIFFHIFNKKLNEYRYIRWSVC